MADGDMGVVEGRLPLVGLSSEIVRVISCGDPEDGVVVGPVAWARTWLRLELLMVRVISWGPVEVDMRPCDVIT
jgi:hypothetical protein